MSTAIFDTDELAAWKILAPHGPILQQAISQAIANERERCAQIADGHAKSTCSGMKDQTEAMRLGARSIADAIRAPERS
jgi:hypothetical protein